MSSLFWAGDSVWRVLTAFRLWRSLSQNCGCLSKLPSLLHSVNVGTHIHEHWQQAAFLIIPILFAVTSFEVEIQFDISVAENEKPEMIVFLKLLSCEVHFFYMFEFGNLEVSGKL